MRALPPARAPRSQNLLTTEVLPAWLRTYCPSVKRVVLGELELHSFAMMAAFDTDHDHAYYGTDDQTESSDDSSDDLADAAPAPAPPAPGPPPAPPAPAPAAALPPAAPPVPLACPSLEHVAFIGRKCSSEDLQQLEAQPSLTSISACSIDWVADDAIGPPLLNVKKLELAHYGGRVVSVPASIPTVLPQLEELHMDCLYVTDDGLGVLRSMTNLRRLTVKRLIPKQSHVDTKWVVDHLVVETLDVRSLVRLPLEGIRMCTYQRLVPAGREAGCDEREMARVRADVERIREAVERWGGQGAEQLLIEAP